MPPAQPRNRTTSRAGFDVAEPTDLVRAIHATPQRTVLETISERSGDCTEFADMLTTLARAAGLPAQTVMGLAYSERSEASLAFHAWNEVWVDGDWHAVDPTWNQLRADATHIPLPDNQAALLHSMQGRDPLAFEIDAVIYAEDT